MANRKYRHNINESRTTIGVNGDLTGYEDLFCFSVIATDHSDVFTAGVDIKELCGNRAGNVNTIEDSGKYFNYEIVNESRGFRAAFKADNTPIDSIFNDIDMTAEFTGRLTAIDFTSNQVRNNDRVKIFINGQFGQLNIFENESGGDFPRYGGLSMSSNGNVYDEGTLIIHQWGKKNKIQNWERFGKAFSDFSFVIDAIDEPQFAEGCSLYRAFEDTMDGGEGNTESGGVFTNRALATVNSWDSNKWGNGQRIFENGVDLPNLDGLSFSGGDMSYGFYMRSDMSSITDRGAGMIPSHMAGWAGYASDSFSSSFQGSTGIHNWEKVNTSQCVDMQYFAWQNTRAKSLGTMEKFNFSKCENFTAMFGHTGHDSYGAEGELLIDPSNWDMSSAKTLFYMFGIETPNTSSWAGELNWKSMKNVIDIHSVVKNRNNYTGARLDEFASYSGNVVLFRSAFAKTAINYDFSNWDFSGVDATRTDVQFNENNGSGIMGGFVRDCESMSPENTFKLLQAWDRPFGQGGLPVSGVDPEIGTAAQTIDFGTTYETRFAANNAEWDTYANDAADIIESLINKGYVITGLSFWE